jgi:hypothetical protein
MRETWVQRVHSQKFFFCSTLRDITFSISLIFLQYHASIFYATYHSSSSRQNILSTIYRRNNMVQIEQKSYRGFRRIDLSKLIYRQPIYTIQYIWLSLILIQNHFIQLVYHNPDSQSNKGNYKYKSCLIQFLFGLLVCYCHLWKILLYDCTKVLTLLTY